jgi:hypothetical protein
MQSSTCSSVGCVPDTVCEYVHVSFACVLVFVCMYACMYAYVHFQVFGWPWNRRVKLGAFEMSAPHKSGGEPRPKIWPFFKHITLQRSNLYGRFVTCRVWKISNGQIFDLVPSPNFAERSFRVHPASHLDVILTKSIPRSVCVYMYICVCIYTYIRTHTRICTQTGGFDAACTKNLH